MNTLNPCPFCGGKAEFERVGTARYSTIIRCTDCHVSLETGETADDAGESWNNRESDKQLAKANECVKELQWALFNLDDYLSDKNKFAIDKMIEGVNWFSEKYCDDEHSFLADKAIEQLRKEQEQ